MQRAVKHDKIKVYSEISLVNWEAYLQEKGISFEKIEYFPDYILYKVPLLSEEQKKELKARQEVQWIQPMYRYYLNFQVREKEGKEFKITSPDTNRDYPIVGILDNGIAECAPLSPWIYRDEKEYCSEKKKETHGTFVAGVILYGDELSGSSWVGGEKLKVYDAALVPDFDEMQLEEDALFFRLKKAIEEHPWIRIWNLAISIRYEAPYDRISDFGILLDYLQSEYSVLICKSCGNGNFVQEGEKRGGILQGSDTIKSLVVASCNEAKEVSSFSLGGEEHRVLLKPDVAMYGGEVSIKAGKRKIEGVLSFSQDGKVVSSFGTSFATARMTRLLGNVLYWKGDASPLFLKALAVQSANGGLPRLTGFGCVGTVEELKHIYENDFFQEGRVLEEDSFVLEYTNHTVECTLACDVLLDYHQREEYVISDLCLEVEDEEGEKLINSFAMEEDRYTALKKYHFILVKEKGKVKVKIRRRWKTKTWKKEIPLRENYCLFWKK